MHLFILAGKYLNTGLNRGSSRIKAKLQQVLPLTVMAKTANDVHSRLLMHEAILTKNSEAREGLLQLLIF